MAAQVGLNADQWYEKIVSFVPSWYFEDKDIQEAHARGLAKILEAIEEDIVDHVNNTFISLAQDSFLDEHGAERDVQRLDDEIDPQYSKRIRNIKNESNCPDIKSAVDDILMVGTSEIREDSKGAVFVNRDEYVNRGAIVLDPIINVFSILVDKQIHEPYSFVGRENFVERDDFVGTAVSSEYVFNLILETVERNKALGTLYRVIERLGA